MPAVREIFGEYGPEYLKTFAERIPSHHRKVIRAIVDCRTERMGTMLYRCESCGKVIELFRSCGNRHCPTCQHEKASQWLERRLEQLLPVHHFMITFTVPAAFRDFIRANGRTAYAALFRASSRTLKRLASESTYFGDDLPGFFGVLHTWGRQMQYHPHIHYIVPGGAFSAQDHSWHASPQAFYLPVRIMSKMVKSLFFREMKKTKLLSQIPQELWKQDWNVHSQAVGTGVRSIRYLASYVFRTAISDSRIIEIEQGHVRFRYADTKTGTAKTMRLSAFEFIRRFLQHVLPTGFMKIRYYGFLHPCSSIPLDLAIMLLEAWLGVRPARVQDETEHSSRPFCPDCNGLVRLLFFIPPRAIVNTGFT
jgi:hypothetical protein